MGQSVSTELRIVNSSHSAISNTTVSDIDKSDWKDRDERPDKNLQGLYIASGSFVQRRVTLNSLASNCPFTITLTFADGTQDTFRIYQKYATGQRKSGFKHRTQSHDISYRRESENTLVIEVKDTQDTIQNMKAEQTNREALALQDEGRLQEAVVRFDAALASAKHAKVVQRISSNRISCQQLIDGNRRAEQLMEEALALQGKGRLQEAAAQLEEALGLATLRTTVATLRERRAALKEQIVLSWNSQQAREMALSLQRQGRTEEAAASLELAEGVDQLARAVEAVQRLPSVYDELVAKHDICATMGQEALALKGQGQREQAAAKLELALGLARAASTHEVTQGHGDACDKRIDFTRLEEQMREFARSSQEKGDVVEAAARTQLANNFSKLKTSLEIIRGQVAMWEGLIIGMRRGMAVWAEGLELLQRDEAEEGLAKMEEAMGLLKNAESRFQDTGRVMLQEMNGVKQRAERLNAEALALQEQGALEAAAARFEEALLGPWLEPRTRAGIERNWAACVRLLAAGGDGGLSANGQLLVERWRQEEAGASVASGFDCI